MIAPEIRTHCASDYTMRTGTPCVSCIALGALTPSIASSSCRQEDKLSNDGLFVFLRRTEAELARLGASPFSLGASPCKACSPPFMVDFIVFSSLFRVLFVLPVGLARLDVFPFSFCRLECSSHPSQSTKGDFSICWAPGRRLSSAFRSVLLIFFRFLESSLTCRLIFVAEGLFFLFWWIGVLFPPLPIEKCDFWSLSFNLLSATCS